MKKREKLLIKRKKGEPYKTFLKRIRRSHSYYYNKIIFKGNTVRVTVPGLASQFFLRSTQLIRHVSVYELRKAALKLIKLKEKYNF